MLKRAAKQHFNTRLPQKTVSNKKNKSIVAKNPPDLKLKRPTVKAGRF